jgi:5-methylcytosine-specific restriction endonuclease McrA
MDTVTQESKIRWKDMTPEQKLQYQRESGQRHRDKKKLEKGARLLVNTPKAEADRQKAQKHYHAKKQRDEAAALEQGREHQRLLRLKRDGGPVGRLMKTVIKNVMQPYKEARQAEQSRVYNNGYRRDRYANDPDYNLLCRLRLRLTNYARTRCFDKSGSGVEMIGMKPEELRTLLEKTSGLSVDESEVDHIFPLAAFDLRRPEDQRRVMNWANLQLLTKSENASKNDRWPTKAMAKHVPDWIWPDGVTIEQLPDTYNDWSSPMRM